MKRTSRILPALIALFVSLAPSAAAAETAGKGTLASAIVLREVRLDTKGNDEVPLIFGDIPQDVDVNSLIRIEIDVDKLVAPPAGSGARIADDDVEQLRLLSARLRQNIPLLEQSCQKILRLEELLAQGGRGTPEYDAVSIEQDQLLGRFAVTVQAYAAFLSESRVDALRSRGADFDARFSAAVTAAAGAGSQMLLVAFFTEDVEAVQREIEESIRKTRLTRSSIALVLAAYAVVDGAQKRIHLEHYDPLEPGQPVRFDKLNFLTRPEDAERLRELFEQARLNAEALNGFLDDRLDLREKLDRALLATGIDPSAYEASLREMLRDVRTLRTTDWSAQLRLFVAAVDTALQQATGNDVLRLNELRQQAIGMQRFIDDVKREVRELDPQLERLDPDRFRRDLAAAANPVDGLIALVNGIGANVQFYRNWVESVSALTTRFDELAVQLRALSGLVESIAQGLAEAPVPTAVGSALLGLRPVAEILESVDGFVTASRELGEQLRGLADHSQSLEFYVATDFDVPEDAFFVPGSKIKNTFADLRTVAGRREDTPVVIGAKLFAVKSGDGGGIATPGSLDVGLIGEQLDSEVQTLRLKRFGWYNSPMAGAAYVSSQDVPQGQTDETRTFAPHVSWMFQFQSWPKQEPGKPVVSRRPWFNNLGVGLHTVALDMDNNNEQEIGAGVTFSVFREFLQLGYGWNLSLDDDPYYFVGLKLFNFGKGSGIKTVTSPVEGD